MPYVYRYIDLNDGVVKYIGIIKADTNFPTRFKSHFSDEWHKTSYWKIEYITVETIADAEILEGHFIWFYKTGKYYNKAKTAWGRCSFVPDPDKFVWLIYTIEPKTVMENRHRKSIKKFYKTKPTEIECKTIADALRFATGGETIRAKDVAAFLGDKNVYRVKQKYLTGLEAIGGRVYLITEVAERLKEQCVLQ